MVDGCLLRRSASKDGWLPAVIDLRSRSRFAIGKSHARIQVAVEVNHRDLSISGIDRSEKWEYNGVITAKSNDARVMLPIGRDGNEGLPSERIITQWAGRNAMQQCLMALLNLIDSESIVVGSDRDIAAINNLQARMEGIGFEWDVVTTVESEPP